MKLLMISSEFPPGPGGLGRHAFDLLTALHKKGISIEVLVKQYDASESRIMEFNEEINRKFNVKINTIPSNGLFGTLHAMLRFLPGNAADTFILSGGAIVIIAPFLKALFPSRKIVIFVHGSEVNAGNTLRKFLFQLGLLFADRIFPVSNFTKKLLPSYFKKKCIVLPNGISIESLNALEHESRNIVSLKGNPALLTVGSITPRKGQHRVIKALPSIIRKWPNVHYHLVGNPINKNQIIELIESLSIKNHVTIHGLISEPSDLVSFYKNSNVFLMLSENQKNGDVEGFGIANLEANFFGIPVIGARGCGIADAIDEGRSGFLIDGDSSDAIVEAVEKSISIAMSNKDGIQSWALEHDWSIIADNFLRVIRQL